MRNNKRQRFGFLEALEERQVLSATTILVDSNSVKLPSDPNPSVALGDDLYVVYAQLNDLQQSQDNTPFELWKFSDGEQPALVDTIPAVGRINGLAASGHDLYFAVNNQGERDESGIPGQTSVLWSYSVEDSAATRLLDLTSDTETDVTVTVVAATEDAVMLTGTRRGQIQELSVFAIDESPDASDLESVLSINGRITRLDTFTTLKDKVFFEVTDLATADRSLWQTDGTVNGTAEVRRDGQPIEDTDILGTFQNTLVITTMENDATVALSLSQDGQFSDLVANGRVVSADGTRLYSVRGDNELWMTSAQGEESLVWDSEFQFRTAIPGGASFSFRASGPGHESIRTNGSVVVRIDRQFQGTDVPAVSAIDDGQDVNELLFQHDDGSGLAWWTSDGTPEGTGQYFQRYEPQTLDSNSVLHGVAGDHLFFTTHGSSVPLELFASDGINTHSLTTEGVPIRMKVVNDSAFFALQPPTPSDVGTEPWYSDGTPEGTRMIGELKPGPRGSNPGVFTAFGDTVLFVANSTELWTVDHAGNDPSLITDAFTEITAMSVAEDRLFISGSQEDVRNGLWVIPNPGSDDLQLIDTFLNAPERMAAIGGRIFFTVATSDTLEVWTVAAGIAERLLSDDSARPIASGGTISSGVFEVNPGIVLNESYVLPLSNKARDNPGLSIWVTDGTEAGSRTIAELEADFRTREIQVNGVKTHLAFQTGAGIWFSDATEAGTRLFEDGGTVTAAGETDFYTTQNVPVSLVEDVTIDSMSIARIDPASMEREVLLEPGTLLEGRSLFRSESIVELNGNIYFTGSDRQYGDEVRRLDLDPLPGDATGDNAVGFDDFLALSASFGKERDAVFADGDFDGNGAVDFSDYLVLARHFGAAE